MQVGGDCCVVFRSKFDEFQFFNKSVHISFFKKIKNRNECAHFAKSRANNNFFSKLIIASARCEVNKPQSTHTKKGGELSRMYNELVAQFFWPESLLLLHEKTCGHRMLFSKRLSVGKRITRGFFPCISFFFFVLLCCAWLPSSQSSLSIYQWNYYWFFFLERLSTARVQFEWIPFHCRIKTHAHQK